MERLKRLLNESGVDAWRIHDLKTKGTEYYFIRHCLDQNRIKNTRHVTLSVFMKSDEGASIGSANAEIYPDESEEALKEKINELKQRALLVHNPVYSLNKPKKAEEIVRKPFSLRKTASDFITLFNGIEETETEDLNSAEIFVSEKTERLITSEGIDITETYPFSMMEAVVNARNKDHEIELYRMYRSGTCDQKAIRDDLTRTMQYGKDRLNTVNTPALKSCPVIFSGANAVTLCRYFLEKTDEALVYRKMSTWKTGDLYSENLKADKVTLKSLRLLDNSFANRAYDSEGAPVREVTFIDEGVVKSWHGSRQFSSYLNLEDSFIVSNFEVSGGTHTEDELRSGNYLEAVEFSDFQTDSLTGDFYGEIRLAYVHDHGTVTPVSGGSVSGNLNELVQDMKMSSTLRQIGNARIPEYIRLENCTISGSEEEE